MLTKSDVQIIDNLLDKKLDPIKKDIKSIKKEMKTMVNVFDQDYVTVRKRITRVEDHLHLPPLPSDF